MITYSEDAFRQDIGQYSINEAEQKKLRYAMHAEENKMEITPEQQIARGQLANLRGRILEILEVKKIDGAIAQGTPEELLEIYGELRKSAKSVWEMINGLSKRIYEGEALSFGPRNRVQGPEGDKQIAPNLYHFHKQLEEEQTKQLWRVSDAIAERLKVKSSSELKAPIAQERIRLLTLVHETQGKLEEFSYTEIGAREGEALNGLEFLITEELGTAGRVDRVTGRTLIERTNNDLWILDRLTAKLELVRTAVREIRDRLHMVNAEVVDRKARESKTRGANMGDLAKAYVETELKIKGLYSSARTGGGQKRTKI